ncbi:TPA: transposase DNA-binding-containing protein [Pseudomonas aeruginosa]|uniref:transposase DNA-binding-containing protein n=1 Tax=Pseudomonas aeruginosa TaxID=287 RepID=UPI0009A908F2|nr:hypothetical protein [Pseudomonas aeruginosa]MBI7325670.1 hypothetical protein [Pseudomonas aeruginosa]MBI7495043.1 hypothetical protein [Pseudomonas aeruginosa]MBI8713329.1 hypothetical protein [Pseudomonas aeruginosa]MCO3531923.1 hypothetical protein [Pseudomonas aeruginosa]
MTKFVRIDGASKPSDNGAWIAGEVAGCDFRDKRLGKRLSSLLSKLGSRVPGTPGSTCCLRSS